MATKIPSLIWRCLYHLVVILGSERTAEVSRVTACTAWCGQINHEANLWMM